MVRNVDTDGSCGASKQTALVRVGGDQHVRGCFGGWASAWWNLHRLSKVDLEILLLGQPP